MSQVLTKEVSRLFEISRYISAGQVPLLKVVRRLSCNSKVFNAVIPVPVSDVKRLSLRLRYVIIFSPVTSKVAILLPLRLRDFNAVIPVPVKDVRVLFEKVNETNAELLLTFSVVSESRPVPVKVVR